MLHADVIPMCRDACWTDSVRGTREFGAPGRARGSCSCELASMEVRLSLDEMYDATRARRKPEQAPITRPT